jgi:hypothetical protein
MKLTPDSSIPIRTNGQVTLSMSRRISPAKLAGKDTPGFLLPQATAIAQVSLSSQSGRWMGLGQRSKQPYKAVGRKGKWPLRGERYLAVAPARCAETENPYRC